ncbi:formylglycine-generating enzyme family protein [Terasakiella sp. A23]|uniref:formylglycine-generating enzyme family protein n=1 Tax=Terasakiella sp. FCG-A23 TaxID=3080561 RepID=UPI0029557B35|nr:formylglycine-generating enzyme family protein [Terasakiella sp. A23]MDV7339527.1 formylglycine-generating enzyme family protein [Terasakiella sp. A23]
MAQEIFQDVMQDGQACQNCPVMVRIKPGHFYMGAIPNVGHDDERAKNGGAFLVPILKSFSVSVGEITRQQFAAFLEDQPDYKLAEACAGLFEGHFLKRKTANWHNPGFDQMANHPVVCVRWRDALAYTEWISKKTGMSYRLLSEGEWEYVARAGTLNRYWWGEGLPGHIANCLTDCQDQYDATAPVYSMPPNPFGLHHMLGNVWEWTQDCYWADAYRRFEGHYPKAVVGNKGCHRVIRGGSWLENAWSLRSSNREGWNPDIPLNDIGFRVARDGQDQGL